MRKMAIAALAASLAFIVPGIASAKIAGTVSIGYEHSSYDYDNSYYGEGYYSCYYCEDHEQGPTLSASVVGPLMGDGPWIIQGDAQLVSETEHYDHESYKSHDSVGHVAAHVAYRTEAYTVGAFYGMENDHGSDVQEIGIEAQKYFDNFTLQGSVAYGDHQDSCSGCQDDYNAWAVNAGGTYYFNDTWSASANVGYAEFDYGYSASTELTTVGVAGEYRVPNTNFSVRAAYTYGDASDTYVDYTSNTFQVGLVIDLGSGSARERDREGASLNGAAAFDQQWRLWEPSYYGVS